jgi:hypothetical protein
VLVHSPTVSAIFFVNILFLIRFHHHTLITFPEGTRRQTIWPRTICERYRIILPNGLELRQFSDRVQDINQLFIVLDKN